MKTGTNARGFSHIMHPTHLAEACGGGEPNRLVSQSSTIGDYDDSFDKPGSSYLWVGDNHHLNREEVADFITHLQHWVETGDLADRDNG